jgi:NAD(P)-dependent dehydrogenase (short-subunit alcohol dehydrogenase family)
MSSRTVVVTGGSSGIGAQTVAKFGADGSHVIILDRSAPTTPLGDNQRWIQTDLSNAA